MKKQASLRSFLIMVFVVGIAGTLLTRAYADDDCRGHSCNDGGDVDIDIDGGDVTVPVNVDNPVNVNHTSKNKSLALANSLGDVDIAGCLGSTQWSTPLFGKQKLVLNQVCMAEFYLMNQKYTLAAMALCNVPEILKEFDTEDACEKAHDFGPVEVEEPESPPVSYVDHDEDIVQVQMAQNDLYSRIEALEQKPAPRVVQAAAPAPEPQPRWTQEQRMAVFSKLGIKEDEDE